MPHLVYGEQALRKLYPPLEVPEAVDAEDPQNDEGDALVEAGNKVIKDIVKATEQQGRKRRLKRIERKEDDDDEDEPEEEEGRVEESHVVRPTHEFVCGC